MKHFRIGIRLMLSFGIVIALMFAGTGIALWQINSMHYQAQQVHKANMQVVALLSVYSDVLKIAAGEKSINRSVQDMLHEVDENIRVEQARSVDMMQQVYSRALATILVTGLITLLAASILGYLVLRSIIRPLKRLDAGAKSLGNGEFHTIPVSGNDELTNLEEAFNFASSQLHVLYEELKSSETHFRSLIENASDIISVLGEDGTITYGSPSFEYVLGYKPEDLIGKNTFKFIHPEDETAVLQKFRNSMVNTRAYSVEFRFLHKNGQWRHIEAVCHSLIDNEILMGIVVNARDITERKQDEEVKKKLEIKLIEAQKMESIGTLAGGIAHDFNNILSAIIGYTELGMLNISDPPKAQKVLKEALKAGERAKDLVKQILTFSRKAEAKCTPVALDMLVKDSLKMLRSAIPSTIDIRHDSLDHGYAIADPTQVHQVVMNLCTNAAHAMDSSGGILELSLKKVALPDASASYNPDLAPGPYLLLSVKDTGYGMTEDVVARIFEPYFTTKEEGRGTGLGLAVVQGIVKSHRGAVNCTSVPGQGTVFDIYLPEAGNAGSVADIPDNEPLPKGSECILFVDDELFLRSVAKEMLEGLGYRVIVKEGSAEALEFFLENSNRIHVVITDMTMPGMTGDRLAQKLLEIRSDLPIILCTGYNEHITEEDTKKIGIREFIMKPFDMKVLAKAVRSVLG